MKISVGAVRDIDEYNRDLRPKLQISSAIDVNEMNATVKKMCSKDVRVVQLDVTAYIKDEQLVDVLKLLAEFKPTRLELVDMGPPAHCNSTSNNNSNSNSNSNTRVKLAEMWPPTHDTTSNSDSDNSSDNDTNLYDLLVCRHNENKFRWVCRRPPL